jgi:hypothetical protein
VQTQPKSQAHAIVRSVPPIVSEAVWEQAQATLQHNLRFGRRHCRRLYPLRGVVNADGAD